MRLEGKVAIVTGGGRGIGKAYCLRLAQEGAKVAAVDIIDTSGTVREIEEHGGNAISINADVSSEQDTLRMAEETIAKFGRIDILVNNAAVLSGLERTPFEQIDPGLWNKVMAVNVNGCWYCARAVVPQMKKQGKGKIINIASIVVFLDTPGMMHYTVSKAAVIGMTYALANELGAYNICVNAVGPGFVRSEAGKMRWTEEESQRRAQSMQLIKRVEYPDDITGTIAFLASDDADLITGQTIFVDGGTIKH